MLIPQLCQLSLKDPRFNQPSTPQFCIVHLQIVMCQKVPTLWLHKQHLDNGGEKHWRFFPVVLWICMDICNRCTSSSSWLLCHSEQCFGIKLPSEHENSWFMTLWWRLSDGAKIEVANWGQISLFSVFHGFPWIFHDFNYFIQRALKFRLLVRGWK